MNILTIEQGGKTPYIYFNSTMGVLDIIGKSLPENSVKFYNDVVQKLDQYIFNPQKKTFVNIYLEYVNSSSLKCIHQILKKIDLLHIEGSSEIVLNWFYEQEDEDMKESGENFEGMMSFDFIYQGLTE